MLLNVVSRKGFTSTLILKVMLALFLPVGLMLLTLMDVYLYLIHGVKKELNVVMIKESTYLNINTPIAIK